ncbi:hypothetical protein [Nocardia brasiliensis]|uniref:hypothetical protein n=1 Tax=Nocardia brasiliensis TaxID=37326 RepID=UPI002455AABE|nr:hypothetical protein [Nocardia brasiliensis]
MQAFIVGLIFGLIFVSCTYSASKGYRGVATSPSEGYGEGIPDTTLTDPQRRKKANNLVAFWATLSAALCLPPIAYTAYVAMDPGRRIPLPVLVLLAVYAIVVCSTAAYPLDKIKK